MCHTWRSVTSEVVQGPILLDTWGGNRRHPCWSKRWCPPQAAANTLEGRAAIQSGLAGTSWNSTQTNAKSCSWGGTSPWTGTGWGPTGWASLLCRKGLGDSSLTRSQQHPPPCQQEGSQEIKRSNSSPFPGICQAILGPLLLALQSCVLGRHW